MGYNNERTPQQNVVLGLDYLLAQQERAELLLPIKALIERQDRVVSALTANAESLNTAAKAATLFAKFVDAEFSTSDASPLKATAGSTNGSLTFGSSKNSGSNDGPASTPSIGG